MTTPIGIYRVGASMSMALDLMPGGPTINDVTSIVAAMRRVRVKGTTIEFLTTDIAIQMAVSPRPASGDIPAGWNLTLSGAQTASIAPGLYGIDVKITIPNASVITERSGVIEFTRGALQ